MDDEVDTSPRGWQLACIQDVPALPPADDPDFWSPWTSDPEYHLGWHSLGRHLGVRAFGVNAKDAEAGRELVARHSETEFGGQEELYVLVRGRARFTCDGTEVELGPGDALFVGADVVREALALETPTLVVAVGAVPGEAYVVPDWNVG